MSVKARVEVMVEVSIEVRVEARVKVRVEVRMEARVEVRVEARVEARVELRVEVISQYVNVSREHPAHPNLTQVLCQLCPLFSSETGFWSKSLKPSSIHQQL